MDKPRLLVVEDDPMSQRAWNAIFTRRGWDVAVAGSVAEALDALATAPDYLILDLLLPDGDGEVILRKVRDDKLKTRVAVTTGSNDTRRHQVVKELSPAAVFEKPVDIAELWLQSEKAKVG